MGRSYGFMEGWRAYCRHCGETQPPYRGSSAQGLFRASQAWVRRHSPKCQGPEQPVLTAPPTRADA